MCVCVQPDAPAELRGNVLAAMEARSFDFEAAVVIYEEIDDEDAASPQPAGEVEGAVQGEAEARADASGERRGPAVKVDHDVEVFVELWPKASGAHRMISPYEPAPHDQIQHRLGAEFELGATVHDRVAVRSRMGVVDWHRRDAKIPGSFLNAESSAVIDKTHALDVLVRAWGPVWLGVSGHRRAVYALNATRRWVAGQEGQTVGYYDGIWPTAEVRTDNLKLRMMVFGTAFPDVEFGGGPPKFSVKEQLTLNPPDVLLEAEYQRGRLSFEADAAFGGDDRVAAVDASVLYQPLRSVSGLRLGLTGGNPRTPIVRETEGRPIDLGGSPRVGVKLVFGV